MTMRRNPNRWRAFEARMGREQIIMVTTVRADGRPHVTPVYFVWLEEHLYFATASYTQKYTNLRHNQDVSLILPDTEKVVIIEGEAHACDRAKTDRLGDYFYNKFEWDFREDRSADWRLVEVTPHKIIVWGDGYDNEGSHLL